MVAPGMLQNDAVRKWLDGIEPAWTLLDQPSFNALRRPPSPTEGPIRLAANLTCDELRQSAVARNTLILLRAAASGPGLKLTAAGNLSRGVVSEMCGLFTWPDYDTTQVFQFNKVVNEADFQPLFFVRHVAQSAQLLRRYKGHLEITPAGRRMLEPPNMRVLQAVLFHIAFWFLDIGDLGRDLHHGWPQRDVGIVLWSVSVAANNWEPRERLTRLCTIPINGVVESAWDTGSYAMEARILRPLLWFGLLEHSAEEIAEAGIIKRHLYRKTALFDRFISFEARIETSGTRRH